MRVRIALVALIGTSCGILVTSLAAQGTREPDLLSALLTEVRGLRQAMEQMASAGPRVQLALGRLQLQEQRVNGMIRRLESLRDTIVNTEKENASIQAQLANIQTLFKQDDKDAPPGETNPMLGMMTGFKKALAAGEAELLRLQGEEAQLQQQIAAEQGRWSDINRTLEDLERALAKR